MISDCVCSLELEHFKGDLDFEFVDKEEESFKSLWVTVFGSGGRVVFGGAFGWAVGGLPVAPQLGDVR